MCFTGKRSVYFLARACICLLAVGVFVGCQHSTLSQMQLDQSAQSAPVATAFLRPNFHYTPRRNWMNDPNGMVFYAGEFHLFYQYHPDDSVWGPMHWGHAVSKDMLHWQQLPIALYPDELGSIFSGSVVIDWHNSSGLGTAANPAMVALFTYHDAEREQAGHQDFQTQGLAFSLDKGRTWNKYQHNPVIKNPGFKAFRDPKVFWYEPQQKWVMVLTHGHKLGFYSSKNLLNWQLESQFSADLPKQAGVWECPDLIRMRIEGTDKYQYVLIVSTISGAPNGGSGTQYFVGDFDGAKFTLTQEFEALLQATSSQQGQQSAIWLDHGTDNYAGVTFSNLYASTGRWVLMGWANNWDYAERIPTFPWRGSMTLPRQLSLRKNQRLVAKPIDEISSLVTQTETLKALTVRNTYVISDLLPANRDSTRTSIAFAANQTGIITLRFANDLGQYADISLDFDNNQVQLDRRHAGRADFDKRFASVQRAQLHTALEKLSLEVFYDKSIIEVFINQGETLITALVFPDSPYTKAMLKSNDPVAIAELSFSTLAANALSR